MLIRRPRGWEIPESAASPEALVLDRRALLVGTGAILAGAPALGAPMAPPLSEGRYAEFGAGPAALEARSWTVAVDGLVETPLRIGIDDLTRRLPVEERLYRHRCVEGWALTVPWTGFPLRALIALAGPLSGARYVRLEGFLDPTVAPGQRQTWYPWPYAEGLAIDEAMHDLAFLATGAYGRPLPARMGAPIRLAVPWKYAFKSIKAVARVTLTAERPRGFWEGLQPAEYGFWANVNPAVPHPRWSQATERVPGDDERRPTRPFNGYAPFVAGLYRDRAGERLYF